MLGGAQDQRIFPSGGPNLLEPISTEVKESHGQHLKTCLGTRREHCLCRPDLTFSRTFRATASALHANQSGLGYPRHRSGDGSKSRKSLGFVSKLGQPLVDIRQRHRADDALRRHGNTRHTCRYNPACG